MSFVSDVSDVPAVSRVSGVSGKLGMSDMSDVSAMCGGFVRCSKCKKDAKYCKLVSHVEVVLMFVSYIHVILSARPNVVVSALDRQVESSWRVESKKETNSTIKHFFLISVCCQLCYKNMVLPLRKII